MTDIQDNAVAIVGLSAILPDAPDAAAFWRNVTQGRYAISEVDSARWDPTLYFDPDPKAPEKTYSKIGGWVREWEWDPLGWHLPIPPRVSDAMDDAQKWGVACTRMALADYGWPERPLDVERTAVVVGNAMAGEKHYLTVLRLTFPELARELANAPTYASLSQDVRESIASELHTNLDAWLPDVTEDTMPGELGNCLAGRIANLFNLRGPNFVVDAACASAMAAMDASVEGLLDGSCDAVVAGGIDRNMGASTFIKFSAIGALSGTGTRPYADGADGFVMGEGAALFVLKRLADAERAGDRIYAVLRGIGGASDGKGKGITAPNPIGQRLAVQRAWAQAGLSPSRCSLIEGHGTSTRVGDVVEVSSLGEAFAGANLAPGSVALGSVKSNIGHLKGAAGAAGILKATLALHHKVLPPSLGFASPNPNIDWSSTPFAVNTEMREWETADGEPRVAGVSAFGFGGTNFHAVLEEYVSGRRGANGHAQITVATDIGSAEEPKAPLRGAFVIGGDNEAQLAERLQADLIDARAGRAPEPAAPEEDALRAPERIAIDYGGAGELAEKGDLAMQALRSGSAGAWKALRGRGIFHGKGPPGKVAFLFTGQGSQYANMLADLRQTEPIVAEVFEDADRVMRPLLEGRTLSDLIFVDRADTDALASAEAELMRTEITQPAVLAADTALLHLLAAYGVVPDLVMGHSLGEYGALIAAGVLRFDAALEAVSARGREMASLEIEDPGAMAAVSAPLEEVERVVAETDGYVVIANINSTSQVVLGGATDAVMRASELLEKRGHATAQLPVSHAFHTEIVAPAAERLRTTLRRLKLAPPGLPVVANVDGAFYPSGAAVEENIIELLGRQMASPVQFIKGLHTLYDAGARVFVEVGPKRALWGFADDVLGSSDVLSLYTNHPKLGDLPSFNHALCGLHAAGLGVGRSVTAPRAAAGMEAGPIDAEPPSAVALGPAAAAGGGAPRTPEPKARPLSDDSYRELGRRFADLVARERVLLGGDGRVRGEDQVVITGAALGTPGTERVFDDENLARLLHGEQLIDVIPSRVRHEIADRHITRLVKREDGEATFETIDSPADVIKLAACAGHLDLAEEFGVDPDRVKALGHDSQLAIAAGIDALRDAGIPLVREYKTTTTGTKLPERWMLPEELRDDTAVIYASAFPGLEDFAEEVEGFWADRLRRTQLESLEAVRSLLTEHDGGGSTITEIDRRIHDLRLELDQHPYRFDRRFLFRALSMGHSQLAELIGARGPNTQINSACASTTQAVALAEDWIRAGRCRRALIIAADDASSERLLPWIGAGFLASGAAATDEVVEEAALPFDRRRHGMLIGMGAAALVVESAAAVRERGITPICEVLSAVTANSAFHGTRLDVAHIAQVMEQLVRQAEASGIARGEIAEETLFVSHETYTPARGGSAAAEIRALRQVFGADADRIVIANTKGLTGHPMGVGIEDVVAVKALETGLVPPVPNFRDVDPELGTLNLSPGGLAPVRYALRLAAGFGSQISLMLLRWTPVRDGRRRNPEELGYAYRISDHSAWMSWLRRISAQQDPRLEVVKHRLRVVDSGPESAAGATETPASVAGPAPPDAGPAPADTVPPPKRATAVEAAIPTPETAAKPTPKAPAEPTPAAPTEPTPAAPAEPTPAAPTEPPPSAPAEPTPTQAEPGALDEASVSARILGIVAEETGYPEDLLDPDLDLEADLGIDTVKQAEMFAAIREAYAIPRDDSLKLRDYPTLHHAVRFVQERAPQPTGAPGIPSAQPEAPPPQAEPTSAVEAAAQPTPQAASVAAAADAGSLDEASVSARILGIVAEETGYPEDLLDPDLDLEADLGIDTVKQAEMFAAIREAYAIPRDDSLKLRDYPTLHHAVRFVQERVPEAAEAASVASAPAGGAAPPPAEPASAAESAGEPTRAAAAEPTPAAPAEPTPAALASAAEPGALDEESVTARILGIVAAETGYPQDLLDPDLDLEADLGIDTVKQAEMFAAIREAYAIPRDDSLKLRDYPTLRHAVGFVQERTAEAAAPAPQTDAAMEDETAEAPDEAQPTTAAGPEFPRRVPVSVLRPPFDLCVPTGVTLGESSRVVLMPDRGGVAGALSRRLAKLGVEVLMIDDAPEVEALEQRIEAWRAEGPIQGVYWLAALDDEGPLTTIDHAAWRAGLHLRVKLLAATMRALADDVVGPGTFLVSATRLGGRHGAGTAAASSVMGGAVTGFSKALARERTDALVKAVDFPPSRQTAWLADVLIDETLRDPGAVEIGHADDLRWTVSLVEQEAVADSERVLGADSTFLVTGAAGSIVSAITADLASASGGVFHLFDLVPEPDPDDPDIRRFQADREGLKLELAERIKAQGERPTPRMIERELARIERASAALDAISAIRDAGGNAHWHQVDLTDPEQVAAAVAAVRSTADRVDVLLHCAGIEISHFLPDKPQHEYDLVFDVKCDGWFNLLHALRSTKIGTAVVFSSIAGRLGNAGQTDYSAANDLLCKSVSALRGGLLPEAPERAIAIDWTAWAGIGMASRGSIPKMMELAEIDTLPPAIGVPIVRREIVARGDGGEVLVAGSLGALLEERHQSGGLDGEAATTQITASRGPMTGRIEAVTLRDGLCVSTELDPTRQPFLDHHRIEGTPVLPGVMGIEGFAEAAHALLPGWSVVAIEDVDLRSPFKFYRDEPRTLELRALLRDGGDDCVVADCRLVGRRTLPGRGEQEIVHFTGRVRLAKQTPSAPRAAWSPAEEHDGVGCDAVYRVYFHGPAYRVLDHAYGEDGEVVGRMAADLPDDYQPAAAPTELEPRLIELCFQTAGIWELGTAGQMGLPTHVDLVAHYGGADDHGPLWAVVRPRPDGPGEAAVDAEVVDGEGRVRLRLEGYRTTALPGAVDAQALIPIRAALGAAGASS
jgi:acyl transferase domain-containing protein/acyl carrier protein